VLYYVHAITEAALRQSVL